ncbi:MAG: cation transporter [Clostridiales bacterium]|nr:cation transporter [Clostridiales bacterium]
MTNILIRLFIKDYKNTSDFQVRGNYGKFASIMGIVSNFLLFILKITVGLLFNSISIVADAVNNLSDSGSSLVTLVGFRISEKPADREHPFGHARMEYVSGLIVSFVILVLGLQLVKSSIEKIIAAQTSTFSMISIVILVAAILIKIWQNRLYKKIGSLIDSITLMATSADSRNDVLATSAVLIATLLTKFTGINLDGYMGVVVALFIMISGVRLVMDTTSPLLGTAPSRDLVESINAKIMSYENIIGIHDLAVHNYGAAKCFASVHCEVPAEQDIMVSHDIIDNIERDFLNEKGIHLVIHLDPVVTSDARTNELKAKVQGIIKDISPMMTMHDFRVVWGISHSNLIFDVMVPYDFQYDDNELVRIISERIHKLGDTYYAVVIVDHNYTPEDGQ